MKAKAAIKIDSVVIPALFACYIYAVIKIILFKFSPIELNFMWQQLQAVWHDPLRLHNRLQIANFTPFLSISRNLHRLTNGHDAIHLFGNIALFIPMGLFIGLRKGRSGTVAAAFLASLGFSLSLECAQIVFSIGSFDVDDLILNTLGGLSGVLMMKVISFGSRVGRPSRQERGKQVAAKSSEHWAAGSTRSRS